MTLSFGVSCVTSLDELDKFWSFKVTFFGFMTTDNFDFFCVLCQAITEQWSERVCSCFRMSYRWTGNDLSACPACLCTWPHAFWELGIQMTLISDLWHVFVCVCVWVGGMCTHNCTQRWFILLIGYHVALRTLIIDCESMQSCVCVCVSPILPTADDDEAAASAELCYNLY